MFDVDWKNTNLEMPSPFELVLLANPNRHWADDFLGCKKAIGYLSEHGYNRYWSVGGERALTLDSFTRWIPLPSDPENDIYTEE